MVMHKRDLRLEGKDSQSKIDEDETYFMNQNAFFNLIQGLTFPKDDTLSLNDDQPEPLD